MQKGFVEVCKGTVSVGLLKVENRNPLTGGHISKKGEKQYKCQSE
jgi:hypothetical protein